MKIFSIVTAMVIVLAGGATSFGAEEVSVKESYSYNYSYKAKTTKTAKDVVPPIPIYEVIPSTQREKVVVRQRSLQLFPFRINRFSYRSVVR